jgi:hypothetical protein
MYILVSQIYCSHWKLIFYFKVIHINIYIDSGNKVNFKLINVKLLISLCVKFSPKISQESNLIYEAR